MRSTIVLLLVLSGTASANTDFGMVGLGSTFADGKPGWILRTELRMDLDFTEEDDNSAIWGARIGLELWGTGAKTGFSIPVGLYQGAQIAHTRMTVGAGVGLWAVDRHDQRSHQGFAPFVSSSIELWREELLISLDVRLTRQLVAEARDFNVYSVMLMVGKLRD